MSMGDKVVFACKDGYTAIVSPDKLLAMGAENNAQTDKITADYPP